MRGFKLYLKLLVALVLVLAFQNCSSEFNSNFQDGNTLTSTVPESTSISEQKEPSPPKKEEPPVKPIREITLNGEGQVLDGSTHNFSLSDSGAINGVTRYDIWIDGKDYSTSVVAPATSVVAFGLPTDGKEHTVTLRPPAGYTEDEFTPFTAKFIAADATDIDGEIFPLNFGHSNIPFGSLTSDHLASWVPGLRASRKREHLSVVMENGQGVLRHRYTPSSTGSERVVFQYNIPHQRSYRMKYSVYFEPGFKWGSQYQGGKLAFGFGGGAAPSGGQVNSAGFTARVMWRGNYLGGGKYDGTGRFVMYTYNADRDLSKSTVGLDTQFGNYSIPIGQWIDVVFEVTMNSATSKSDGSMRGWVNGNLLVNKGNMKWWASGDQPRIDTLYYSSFYGGSNAGWAPPNTTYIKVRDVAFAPVINGLSAISP